MDAQIDYQQLLMAIGDGVVVADAEGKIVFWNPGAERIFGFTGSDAIGQTLDLIVPERQRHRHWEGFDKTMQTGETRYGNDLLRVPALHKEGHPLSIAFSVAMLHAADGKVSAIVAIVRDETKRWDEEQALRGRVKELEAKSER